MDFDKYIGGKKIKRIGNSQQENVEIERRSILSIRSNSEILNQLFEEISLYQPSMMSPNASPIKQHTNNSNTTFNYTPIKQFIQPPSFKKVNTANKQYNNPQIKSVKKKSISSVHFTNYMNPIGKISDKLKGTLEKQKKLRELQQQKQFFKLNSLKQKSRKQYENISSKYKECKSKNSLQQQAIVSRLIQRQQEEMSGVTFMPKINKNYQINQSFQTRLFESERKKQIRQGQIIKQMLKNQTYNPKINKNKVAQSKIKNIWFKPVRTSQFENHSSYSFSGNFQTHQLDDRPLFSQAKTINIDDLKFINKR